MISQYPIHTLDPPSFPFLLTQIQDPPLQLFVRGRQLHTYPEDIRWLCVVGSRTPTPYGKEVCESLIRGLSGKPIGIISGLAYGIDSLAHKYTLKYGLPTIAVPGSGLADDSLYPSQHKNLAHEILTSGNGSLVSEFDPHTCAAPWMFPQRNRIMAGLSHAVLVIEAAPRSGTLITAKCALDYNRDVCTVPGSIFSERSHGPHSLIKLGATPITSSEDILEVLSMPHECIVKKCGVLDSDTMHSDIDNLTLEQKIIAMITRCPSSIQSIADTLNSAPEKISSTLSTLEIESKICEKGGLFYIL